MSEREKGGEERCTKEADAREWEERGGGASLFRLARIVQG